jgi:hypothetical protein
MPWVRFYLSASRPIFVPLCGSRASHPRLPLPVSLSARMPLCLCARVSIQAQSTRRASPLGLCTSCNPAELTGSWCGLACAEASQTEGDVLSVIAGKGGAAKLTETTRRLAETTTKTWSETSKRLAEQAAQVKASPGGVLGVWSAEANKMLGGSVESTPMGHHPHVPKADDFFSDLRCGDLRCGVACRPSAIDTCLRGRMSPVFDIQEPC